nr:hypothetical protein [Tanacetum cinerariifolium]
MYYPQFKKVIIYYFMSKDLSIPRRNKYAVATEAAPPKLKASVRKTRSSFDTTITPPTAASGPRLTTFEKGKQATKASKDKILSALSKNSTDEEGDDDEGKDGDGDEEDNGDDSEEGDGDDNRKL